MRPNGTLRATEAARETTKGENPVQDLATERIQPRAATDTGVTVRVLNGPDAGRTLAVTRSALVVGSHATAQLRLDDRSVSRFHCELRLDGRPHVRDLGSRNGTFVDGVEVDRCYLREGSIITIGRTHLRLEQAAARRSVATVRRRRFGHLVGSSDAMNRVFTMLEGVAKSEVTVLLTGETGTGKELAAQSIHEESDRAGGPFVVVDCSATHPELIESELFGHEKGSFTGATGRREGAFAAADGGTVFLDEIGELPLALQPKLLRVLESRQVKPVGSAQYRPVDVRLVAATNRALRDEVAEGRFRSDLFYRLAVVEIELPSLRDRVDDIPALVEHLVRALGAPREGVGPLLAPEVQARLARHRWPGNVRELRNVVEHCATFGELPPDEAFEPGHAELDGSPLAGARPMDLERSYKDLRADWIRAFEQEYLHRLLAETDGNVSAAARRAGVDRTHLYRLLWRNGMR